MTRMNTGDADQLKRMADDQQLKQEKFRNDMVELLYLPSGRHILWDILSECGVFRPNLPTDTNTVLFNEGRRSIGLKLLSHIMDADAATFELMRKEAKKREEDND